MLSGARKSEHINDLRSPTGQTYGVQQAQRYDDLNWLEDRGDTESIQDAIRPTPEQLGIAALAQATPLGNIEDQFTTGAIQNTFGRGIDGLPQGYAKGGSVGSMPGDLSHAYEEVKSLPSEALHKELSKPTGFLPDWVVMGELHSREAARSPSITQPFTLKDQMMRVAPGMAKGGLVDLTNPMLTKIHTVQHPDQFGSVLQELINQQASNQAPPMAPMAPMPGASPTDIATLVPQAPGAPISPKKYAAGGLVEDPLAQIYQNIADSQARVEAMDAADEESHARQLSAQDMDQMVRTVYGEAASEPAAGQSAVASVILNRANQSGMSPTQVVHAKNQFEPWSSNAQRLNSLDPSSETYQRIAQNIQPALQGNDVTGGATHFYAPKAQAALGRDAPSWAQGPATPIGNHVFYNLGYKGGPGAGAPAGYAPQMAQNQMDSGPIDVGIGASQASAINAGSAMAEPASPLGGIASIMPLLMTSMQPQPLPPMPEAPVRKNAGMISPYEYSQTRPMRGGREIT